MRKILISAFAVLIGAVWVVGPAAAQTTTDKIENKAERAKDKVEDKSERAKDKIEDKTERAKDKTEDKAERAKDKTEAKTESTTDKVKDKAHEAKDKMVETKDKVVDKMKGNGSKAGAKADTNVRATQQALRDQGFNPGPIDGRMGPRTSAALRDYQTKQGLTASGQLDDPTIEKLGIRTATAASPTTEPQSAQPEVQKKKQSP